MSKEEVLDELEQKAAWTGQVCVLEWIRREHGRECTLRNFAWAGCGGHLNVLQWGEEQGTSAWFSRFLCRAAALKGQVHVLDWIHQYRRVPEDAAKNAAFGGHVSVLQWMKEHSVLNTNNKLVWIRAARKRKLDVLQWLLDNEFTNSFLAVNEAADKGCIDVLEWARNHDLPFRAPACSLAAGNGHLDTLQWLQDHGCPWDSETIRSALRNGHHSIAQWARDNGCPEPPADEW